MRPPAEDEVLGKAYDARLVGRLREFVAPQAPLMGASVTLMVVVMAAQLAQPYLVKLVIDGPIRAGSLRGLVPLALLYLAALVIELAARYGQLYAMEKTGQNVILALRRRLFSHLQRLDSAFFDRYPVGRLMTRVTTDIESLADLFSSGVVSLLGDSAKLLAIVGILWWLDWRLTLVTLAVAPVLFLLSFTFRGRIRRTYREVRRRIARINAYLQEAISGMLLVQLFRREAENRREFGTINRDHRDAELTSVVYESSFSAIVELIGSVATALIIWFGGGQILRGALTFGTLVAFLEYASRFFGPIRDLSSFYAVMQAAMAALERIFSLLDVRPSITTPAEAASPETPRGRIEFDHVSFAYRPGQEVLKEIRFAIAPGEKVAVVGATGSGKTTLIKLLIRLYDPTAGAIRLDGVDLRRLPLETLRRTVGVVMQDHFLTTGTIASNIAFGNEGLGRDRIIEAARLVHAEGFIHRLPAGYDEPVRERGSNLSVGQKQLLSFARALAYDPAVLVLDEATSSVDTETETLIQDALQRLLRQRTALIIAHRLSTIVGADRILVFHHGRLAEEGTHRTLLALRGIYHRLYQLQFSAGGRGRGIAPAAPEAAQEED
ncbi:MAG TPA: ABC transporter ATP-binding protein, partial [Candidatus Polarisedimenticolia bacterium]|nr:ABC transporter ATP-binding protein [Candidatus Polarisedimenticolia bacterium]